MILKWVYSKLRNIWVVYPFIIVGILFMVWIDNEGPLLVNILIGLLIGILLMMFLFLFAIIYKVLKTDYDSFKYNNSPNRRE